MTFNKTIHRSITINASTIKVWDALTNPEMIKQWLWEEAVNVVSDWKVGSVIFFNGSFYDVAYKDKGTLLKLEPEIVFQYNYWSHLSQLPDAPENYQLIEFRLTKTNQATELNLTCSNLINDAIYGHWNFYWNITLGVLKRLVEAELN